MSRLNPRAPATFRAVEVKEQPSPRTLAEKLGDAAHVSGLAIRLAWLSGARGRWPEWWLKVAVERGARHYQREFDRALPPDNPAIADEEIGVALCLGQMPYRLCLLAASLFCAPPGGPIIKSGSDQPGVCSETFRRLWSK